MEGEEGEGERVSKERTTIEEKVRARVPLFPPSPSFFLPALCCRKGDRIYHQLKKLGSSLDWDRACFTMDPVSVLSFTLPVTFYCVIMDNS